MIELLIGFCIGLATGIATLLALMRYYFTRKLNTMGIESPQTVINQLKSMLDRAEYADILNETLGEEDEDLNNTKTEKGK